METLTVQFALFAFKTYTLITAAIPKLINSIYVDSLELQPHTSCTLDLV